MKENNLKSFKTSIDRLCKVVILKFISFDPQIAIDTYIDIIEIYNKSNNDTYCEYIVYKLNWINQHSNIDNYYRDELIKIYNENII